MCLTQNQFALFIDTIVAKVTKVNETMTIIHATIGDVVWLWNGVEFCISVGLGA